MQDECFQRGSLCRLPTEHLIRAGLSLFCFSFSKSCLTSFTNHRYVLPNPCKFLLFHCSFFFFFSLGADRSHKPGLCSAERCTKANEKMQPISNLHPRLSASLAATALRLPLIPALTRVNRWIWLRFVCNIVVFLKCSSILPQV